MPPKQRITKDDIFQASFKLIREEGMENFNSRNIAKILQCSTRPIFSCYSNMSALENDVLELVTQYHTDYCNKVDYDKNFFFNISMAYIDFALEETNLFKFLFMSGVFGGTSLIDIIDDCCDEDFTSEMLQKNDIQFESASHKKVFTDLWLYAHGLATMLMFNQFEIGRSEIKKMVKNMFDLLLNQNGENKE